MSNGQTMWEQPVELSVASLIPSVPSKPKATNSDIVASWRELTAANGRKYYYNAATKASMWEIPPEYAEYLERIKDPSRLDREVLEEKFMAMLKEKTITSKYSWEEALREVINHPHYKLVPTLTERKALFVRHIELQKEVEKEERHQRAIKDRDEFRTLLRSTHSITSNTRYSEALEIIGNEPAFKAIENPKERAVLYDDYINEVRREEGDRNRQRKRRAFEKFQQLLISISSIKVDTPWRVALGSFSERLKEDEDLFILEPIEQLIGYENHIKELERKEQEEFDRKRREQRRRERIGRTAFMKLLMEMEKKGHLSASTSWRELYPKIASRSEYITMLSHGGSTPLDLFWDHLHHLQESYIEEAKCMVSKLKNDCGDGWLGKINPTDIPMVMRPHLFPTKPAEIKVLTREEIRDKVDTFRKNNRKMIDRLKHCIKHLEPPIDLSTSYEAVFSLLLKQPEFSSVEDDDIRRYYFEKYIRHLRKKAGLEVEKSEDD